MKLEIPNRAIFLDIPNQLLEKMTEHAKNHFPREYGGFLIGQYSSDFTVLYITDFVLPKKFKADSHFFQRTTDGLIDKFKSYYALNPKQFYVGEWHTHPNGNASYSHTDLTAMREIASCKTVHIENPILLIIGVSPNHITEYRFYIFNQNALLEFKKWI